MTTYEPDDLMDLAFEDEFRVQKMIMKVSPSLRAPAPCLDPTRRASQFGLCHSCVWSQSNWLRDAFSEIDPSAERLSISFVPSNRVQHGGHYSDDGTTLSDSNFKLEAIGTLGSTEVSQQLGQNTIGSEAANTLKMVSRWITPTTTTTRFWKPTIASLRSGTRQPSPQPAGQAPQPEADPHLFD